MATFDGWEIGLYGSVEFSNADPYDDNVLAHFRTKGSKNGVRRYQQPDGTWTPLGLRERKQREGWGKHERKAAKLERKLERRTARQERRAAFKERLTRAKAAYQERKGRHSLKNVSDADLQKRIDRLKLEREYKDLNRNPALEAGKNLVKAYINHKNEKLRRATKAAELQVQKDKAKSDLLNAQAARTNARNDLIDNIFGGAKRMKAKAELLRSKRQNTVRGAIGGMVGNVIKAEGDRITSEMKNKPSLLMRAGRKVKNAVREMGSDSSLKIRDVTGDIAQRIKDRYNNRDSRREQREISNLDRSVARNIAKQERKMRRNHEREERNRVRENAQINADIEATRSRGERMWSRYNKRQAREERRNTREQERSDRYNQRSEERVNRAQQHTRERQERDRAREIARINASIKATRRRGERMWDRYNDRNARMDYQAGVQRVRERARREREEARAQRERDAQRERVSDIIRQNDENQRKRPRRR